MAIFRGQSDFSKINPKQFLIELRYPTLKALRANSINVDSFNLEEMLQARQKIKKDVAKYQAKLDALSDAEILSKAQEAKAEIEKKRAQEVADLMKKISLEARDKEKRRYFNKPSAIADIQYWAKMSYWSLEECTVLSFGRSPDIVKLKDLKKLKRVSPFAKELLDTHRLLMRAYAMHQLAKSNIPEYFIAWTNQNGISTPKELVEAVKAHGHQITDWKTLYDEKVEQLKALQEKPQKQIDATQSTISGPGSKKQLHPRTRDNLLRLIIAIAVDAYGFDPKDRKSPIPKELEGHVDRLGMSLSDDTIRKYLKEATELLPNIQSDEK